MICNTCNLDVSEHACQEYTIRTELNHTDTLYIVYDFETTGLNTKTDQITQMSFVVKSHLGNSEFNRYCKVNIKVPPEVVKLNGLNNDFLDGFPSVIQNFADFNLFLSDFTRNSHFKNIVWIAHNNFKFDFCFLKRYESYFLESIKGLNNYIADTYIIAKDILKLPNYKLVTIYQHLFPNQVGGDYHKADFDTRILTQIIEHEIFKDNLSSRLRLFFENTSYNLQQKRIIHADPDRNHCIIAGAGCGKTTTMIARIVNLITKHSVDENSILFMTFTKDAANDMIKKLETKLNRKTSMIVGTIDSIARKIVKQYDPELFNHCQQVGEYKYAFLKFLSKVNCPMKKQFVANMKFLFVDEFQDINKVYFDIIYKFYESGTKINVVGDDAQNIYSWNGSNVDYILSFEKIFNNSDIHFLNVNYRCVPEIIDVANHSISFNECKYEKELLPFKKSEKKKPIVICFENWDREVEFIIDKIKTLLLQRIPLHEIAILSRMLTEKSLLYYIEEKLTQKGIPNQILETYQDTRTKIKENHVCLSTIHKSKGLEWDTVFIIGCADQFFPYNKDNIEEERRLFYVALTRAKRNLYLSLNTPQNGKNRLTLSRFITELPKPLFRWQNVANYHFVLNTVQTNKQLPSITKILESFTTEQIYLLRQTDFFPKNFQEKITKIHKEISYPSWVVTEDLYSDFGTFVDNVICRMFGQYDQKSRGLVHSHAIRLLSRLSLEKQLYDIYRRYQVNFEVNVDRFKLDREYDWKEVLTILSGNCNNSHVKQEKIMNTDYDSLYHIVTRIIEKAKLYRKKPSEIFICTKNFLPQEKWNIIEKSYLKYTEQKHLWQDILWDIFQVSWSSNIEKGRKRLIYKKWPEALLKELLPWFSLICKEFIEKNYTEQPLCKLSFNTDMILAECDLYLGEKKQLIDFKVSKMSTLPIQHWLQVLFYACILRKQGYIVNSLCIYNPLLGNIHEIDISEWNHHNELWKWFLKTISNDDSSMLNIEEFCSVKPNKNSLTVDTSGNINFEKNNIEDVTVWF
jgi:DNA polymerase III epsilon subunit-like protein